MICVGLFSVLSTMYIVFAVPRNIWDESGTIRRQADNDEKQERVIAPAAHSRRSCLRSGRCLVSLSAVVDQAGERWGLGRVQCWRLRGDRQEGCVCQEHWSSHGRCSSWRPASSTSRTTTTRVGDGGGRRKEKNVYRQRAARMKRGGCELRGQRTT